MRKNKLALSQILWIIVSVFVFAFFGTGAVYAYNANLRLNLPVSFQVSACEITFSDRAETILYDSLSNSPTINANVTPVAKDTLELSYTCPDSPVATYSFSVDDGNDSVALKLQLVGLKVYGEVVDVEHPSSTFITLTNNNTSTVSVTFKSGITLAKDDKIIFQIKVS